MVLAAGACSDGSTAQPTGPSTSAASRSTTASVVASATAPSVPPVDPTDYCAAARRFANVDLAASREPGQLRSAFAELRAVLPVMASAAPTELREDLGIVVTGYGKLGAATEQGGWQWGTLAGAVLAIGEDPTFTAAGERVDAYNRRTCGVVPIGSPATTAR